MSNLMNIEFDSEPVYGDNDKYINKKIKMYEDRLNSSSQIFKLKKYLKKMPHISAYYH